MTTLRILCHVTWVVSGDYCRAIDRGRSNYSSAVLFRSTPNSWLANWQWSNASSALPSCNCLIHSSKWRSVSRRIDRFILANTGDRISLSVPNPVGIIIINHELRTTRKMWVVVMISFLFIKGHDKLTAITFLCAITSVTILLLFCFHYYHCRVLICMSCNN